MNSRSTWVEVDLSILAENVRILSEVVSPANFCAVVKANAYGHGAVPVAKAAIEAGATWLAVALTEEGAELRQAGITAPILVLAESSPSAATEYLRWNLTPAVYSEAFVTSLGAAAEADPDLVSPFDVHLKLDTGMHRVGCAPEDVEHRVKAIQAQERLKLSGIFTHLAVADDLTNDFTQQQVSRFSDAVARAEAIVGEPLIRHVANSAAGLVLPESRLDMVRCGIAQYGLRPGPSLALPRGIRPALSMVSQVSYVKRLGAQEALSYGLQYRLMSDANIATIPIGYADGIPRRAFESGVRVLIGGKRRAIAGRVTMDQIMVNCGDDPVEPGDEVVLIGAQGDEFVGAEEWAARLGTIEYEVVTQLGSRVPRRYVE